MQECLPGTQKEVKIEHTRATRAHMMGPFVNVIGFLLFCDLQTPLAWARDADSYDLQVTDSPHAHEHYDPSEHYDSSVPNDEPEAHHSMWTQLGNFLSRHKTPMNTASNSPEMGHPPMPADGTRPSHPDGPPADMPPPPPGSIHRSEGMTAMMQPPDGHQRDADPMHRDEQTEGSGSMHEPRAVEPPAHATLTQSDAEEFESESGASDPQLGTGEESYGSAIEEHNVPEEGPHPHGDTAHHEGHVHHAGPHPHGERTTDHYEGAEMGNHPSNHHMGSDGPHHGERHVRPHEDYPDSDVLPPPAQEVGVENHPEHHHADDHHPVSDHRHSDYIPPPAGDSDTEEMLEVAGEPCEDNLNPGTPDMVEQGAQSIERDRLDIAGKRFRRLWFMARRECDEYAE